MEDTQTPPPRTTIALCMIAGNEEALIERCLDAFAPAFDLLCLVQAIGSQEPDRTLDLAEAWCERNAKRYAMATYQNAPSAAQWAHVDDFSAARNLAFSMADTDWIFWTDCDDLVAPASDIAELRRIVAERPDVGVFLFPYEVPGTNKAPFRERLFRRELAPTWRFPVHENVMVTAKTTTRSCPDPVWLHAPLPHKASSASRNLAILQHALRDVATQLYYVHQEHFYAQNRAGARQWGEMALQFPNLHDSFRYEALLNLGKLAETPAQAADYFARAHTVLPQCREALAGLAYSAFEQGDLYRADQFSAALLRLPEPPPDRRPWTHETKWYRWAGIDLRARILRARGLVAEADSLIAREWGPPVISLIHATRGRNQQAWQCRERWLSAASDATRIEHILCVDQDDAEACTFARQFPHAIAPVDASPASCVRAWNAGAHMALGNVLVQLSDDWMPCWGWDQLILEALKGQLESPRVLAIFDGHRRDDLLCMAICTRARWEQQGRELFSPDYLSVYSDNEFSYRAWRDGVVVDARDRIQFQHLHPAFGHAAWDATYAHSNHPARYAQGRATFLERNPDADPAIWAPEPKPLPA